MAYSTFSERKINGCPVDWGCWYGLSFTPKQGASLAYRIDPLKTKKSDDLKYIQAGFKEQIDRLELRLSSISPSWTLTDLAIFLGDNAPEGMLYQVRNQLHKALINLLRQLAIPKQVVLEDAGTVSQVQISEQPLVLKRIVKRTRTDNLSRAINAAVKDMGRKPSLEQLWQYFQDDRDTTGFIQDYDDQKIVWMDTKGVSQDTPRRSLANRLSRLDS